MGISILLALGFVIVLSTKLRRRRPRQVHMSDAWMRVVRQAQHPSRIEYHSRWEWPVHK